MAPTTTGTTTNFTFHIRWIYKLKFLYLSFFSASFFITRLSDGIATSISKQVLFLLYTFLTSQQFSCFSKEHRSGLTDQALLIHSSSSNFLTIRHVLSTTAFCIRMLRLSSFKLSCNLFGIIPIVDNTSGIRWAVFSCHFLISSSLKSVYLYLLLLLLLLLFYCLLSQAFSPSYFSWTNGDPHRSGFKFQTAILPVLCVMFLLLLLLLLRHTV